MFVTPYFCFKRPLGGVNPIVLLQKYLLLLVFLVFNFF